MKLITVSREYGAGGGEVARRLENALGWDLLDHELLHRAAQLEHLPDSELEVLDEQAISRWLAEAPARKLIAESDDRRRRFYQDYFEVDWSDPLEYDLTVNSGRLGPTAVDLVALAAERFWDRTHRV